MQARRDAHRSAANATAALGRILERLVGSIHRPFPEYRHRRRSRRDTDSRTEREWSESDGPFERERSLFADYRSGSSRRQEEEEEKEYYMSRTLVTLSKNIGGGLGRPSADRQPGSVLAQGATSGGYADADRRNRIGRTV